MAEKNNKRIFVIEDDRDIQEVMLEVLEFSGYSVEAASNGQEALDKLLAATQLPDLIVLDLMMPVMDGQTFRQQQRAHPKLAEIPVILMSADSHLQEKNQQIQANDYIKKPVDLEVLESTIKRWCK